MSYTLRSETLLKRASWSRLYDWDFADFTEMEGGQTIDSATVTVDSVGITVGSPAVSGSIVQARVSGGEVGVDYTVTVTVETSGGDTLSVVGTIRVVE